MSVPRFKLPANHRSTYSLMATLENLGIDPGTASTAIDCVLGPDPADFPTPDDTAEIPLPGEAEWERIAADWEPVFEPTAEDWEALAAFRAATEAEWFEHRLATGYDDEAEARALADCYDTIDRAG